MSYKRCQVVMLPTNQKAINGQQPVSNYSKPITKEGISIPVSLGHLNRLLKMGAQAYHLYILSDDKIEQDDWFIKMNKGRQPRLLTCTGEPFNNVKWLNSEDVNDCFKVIASTDPILNLPKPSKEFLQVYCEKQPKEVLVKYDSELVITNNRISVKKVKKTYTAEEVKEMINRAISDTITSVEFKQFSATPKAEDYLNV